MSDYESITETVHRMWEAFDAAVAAGDVDSQERIRGDINEACGFPRDYRTLSERYPEHFKKRGPGPIRLTRS